MQHQNKRQDNPKDLAEFNHLLRVMNSTLAAHTLLLDMILFSAKPKNLHQGIGESLSTELHIDWQTQSFSLINQPNNTTDHAAPVAYENIAALLQELKMNIAEAFAIQKEANETLRKSMVEVVTKIGELQASNDALQASLLSAGNLTPEQEAEVTANAQLAKDFDNIIPDAITAVDSAAAADVNVDGALADAA